MKGQKRMFGRVSKNRYFLYASLRKVYVLQSGRARTREKYIFFIWKRGKLSRFSLFPFVFLSVHIFLNSFQLYSLYWTELTRKACWYTCCRGKTLGAKERVIVLLSKYIIKESAVRSKKGGKNWLKKKVFFGIQSQVSCNMGACDDVEESIQLLSS